MPAHDINKNDIMNTEWTSSSICERMEVRATWPGTIQLVWRLTARWRMDHFDLVAKWVTRPENENPFWVVVAPRSPNHSKTAALLSLWLSSTHHDELSTRNFSIFFSVCFNWISRTSSGNLPSKTTAKPVCQLHCHCVFSPRLSYPLGPRDYFSCSVWRQPKNVA